MIVPVGGLLRDVTGDFGCPNCWTVNMARVRPPMAECPHCGEKLEWTPEAIEAARRRRAVGRRDIKRR